MANRPLSPHLQVYKWGPHMAASIFHRATGSALSLAALPVLLWWLGALASGPDAYATFSAVATSWIGIIVLIGISWSFFHHSVSGIRHFVLDLGAGFELKANRAGSVATFVIALVLTAAFWAAILL
ncbi:succinate dehydrogenase, cytochrome b556 subunit [Altererythrobacter indicus]|uniref:Succinate dehydrogenase cytochrome b556 subunit n=1 Tax=Altericroceibacterium indicum TaxID=374177 RepID=A0A845A8P8_9SPHN|nr:succinate dehydrogenase, cytochrome b556 subunit [Altericroceibacterium indicum]MXP24936.1 succinate dehydrogenase, cytochrome b556 subunit [Altericroceibacterium indicum]